MGLLGRPPSLSVLPKVVMWGGILALAVGFRVWGLTWGGRTDLNPDEALVLEIASGLTWRSLNPHFFSYCGFVFSQSVLTVEVLKLVGVQLLDFDRLMMHRLWSVFWGVGTVVLVYHLARQLGGSRRAGWIAAALMAIMPLHVWESHFGTTDCPLLFWMMASLLASVRLYDRPTWLHAALAGLCAGIAVGTKYPGAFCVFPFAASVTLLVWEHRLARGRAAAWIAVAGVGAMAGSFAVSPFSFLEPAGTLKAFLYEFETVETGHFGFDLNVPGWQYHRVIYQLFAAFPFGFGIALWLLTVASIVFCTWRASRRMLIALAYVGFFFVITGRWVFVPVRYFMPMFPVFIVMAGFFLDWLLSAHRRVGIIVGLTVAAYTVAFTFTTTRRFVTDTRIQAAEWANRALPAGSTIILAQSRGRAYTARFDSTRFPLVRHHSLRALHRRAASYAEDLASLGLRDARVYVSASSLDYDRYLRTKAPESIAAWEELRQRPSKYRRIQTFETWFLNKRFYMGLDPMFGGYFLSPRLEFYEYLP